MTYIYLVIRGMGEISKELTAASTIPLVLSILSEGENYGYEIIRKVRSISGNEINWKEGTLYPILHKMEDKGLIDSFWSTYNGRKRKYYRINDAGRRTLSSELENWQMIFNALKSLLSSQ